MSPREIGLLGSGSQAAETAEYATDTIIAFRAVSRDRLDGAPGLVDLATSNPLLLEVEVVAAVGAPGLRRLLVSQWAGSRYATVLSPAAWISPSADIGVGSVIAPGAVVTSGARIGRHVLVNVGASVSHNSALGDYATVSPGVRIAGDCSIGAGSFLGIGAIVSHGVTIAEGTVLGAGAVVVDDIDVPGVYVGVPARRVRPLDAWITTL